MKEEWYFSRGQEVTGPISADAIKRLAESGVLRREDLIWKVGSTNRRQAGRIAGLFRESTISDTPTSQEPPSLPPFTDNNFSVALGSQSSSLVAASKAAKSQAELAKLQNITLPGAFARLGHAVYAAEAENGRHDNIRSLFGSIADLKAAQLSNSVPVTLSDKAKQIGSNAITNAKIKGMELQLRQQLYHLGKERYDSSPDDTTHLNEMSQVLSAINQIDTVKREYDQALSSISANSRAVSSATKKATKHAFSLLYSAATFASLLVLCAPLSLILIWKHPHWSKPKQFLWSGVSVATFLLFAMFLVNKGAATRAELAKADQRWDAGDRTEAAELYRSMVNDLAFLDQAQKGRLLSRVIDFECENNRTDFALSVVEKAVSDNVQLNLANRTAQVLVAKVRSTKAIEDEALSADYYPYRPGDVKRYYNSATIGGIEIDSVLEMRYENNGVLKEVQVKSENNTPVRMPLTSTVRKYANDSKQITITEEYGEFTKFKSTFPVLKFGAKTGDTWSTQSGATKITYKVLSIKPEPLYSQNGVGSDVLCACIEEVHEFQGRKNMMCQTTYAKNVGPKSGFVVTYDTSGRGTVVRHMTILDGY